MKSSEPHDSTEDGYEDLLSAVRQVISGPLFTTDAEDLSELFLGQLPVFRRQHYTCTACKKFIDTYGGLVRVEDNGDVVPVLWHIDPPLFFKQAVLRLHTLVRRSHITGVFLSPLEVWGTPVTGTWHHLHCLNAEPFRETNLKNAHQAMAERNEEHGMLGRGLAEFKLETFEQAVRVLKSETMPRSDRFLPVAEWLLGLKRIRNRNILWRAAALAPVGWCHVRSGMIGTLLEDLEAGLPFNTVLRRFAEKVDPLQYQRPTAAPTAGAILQAEKVVAELAATGALKRRFARLSEVEAVWRPLTPELADAGGIFGRLKKAAKKTQPVIPPVTMTWEKFQKTVLPDAANIQIYIAAGRLPLAAFTSGPAEPRILQWDNPVAWYFYSQGASAEQFNLKAGTWVECSAVCLKPSMWGDRPAKNQGRTVFFLLRGARDTKNDSLALFPEALRSEFHGVRKVIEAHSNSVRLEGAAEADACGIGFSADTPNVMNWQHCRLRVTDRSGGVAHYNLDRWD